MVLAVTWPIFFTTNPLIMREPKEQAGTSLPQAFTFNATNRAIRAMTVNDLPYFVAKDVCEALEILQVSKAVQALDDDEKLMGKLFLSGQNRDTWLINESGLYNLIFRSNKPEAKAFRKWVTGEVLPAIRRTGAYGHATPQSTNQPVHQSTYIDARDLAYDTVELNGRTVRHIVVDERDYYSINDIQRAIGTDTSSTQVARKLNAKREMATKIFVFGNTHPAWFCTSTGMQLIISGSRILDRKSISFSPPSFKEGPGVVTVKQGGAQ
ncbi:hypothetical protein BH09BAC1_BH09BAC1_14260 [soil metagenome]